MALEDFEKQLAEEKRAEEQTRSEKSHKKHREHRHHDDEHRHKRRRRSRDEDEHRRRRHDRSKDGDDKEHRHRSKSREGRRAHGDRARSPKVVADEQVPTTTGMKRDSWMEAPSALDVDYVQKRPQPEPVSVHSKKQDFQLKIHENEVNKNHLEDLRDGKVEEQLEGATQHEVDYTFGDAGSKWRMTKLKGVYRKAEDTGEAVEEVAMKQYGDLRAYDDAREEEIELDRRDTYGNGYVGKEKPSGELFQERKLAAGVRRGQEEDHEPVDVEIKSIETEPTERTIPMDQSALNKLRAKMMKAKLRGASDAETLEAEYNAASEALEAGHSGVVVLGTMENRMLAGGRQGEVKSIDNKRGRERGLVEENDDMTIEDMVREERRTRGQAGGEGKRFAERIAKDGKFDVSYSLLRLVMLLIL
jgi:hypothetical protein